MASYLIPVKTAVDFTESLGAYTVPASNAVDFDLLEGAQISLPGPLGQASTYIFNNFYPLIEDDTQQWVMRITSDPVIEIPITSWQATLQTDRDSYLQAVVPDAGQYGQVFDDNQGVSNFEIYRRLVVDGAEFYEYVYGALLQTVTLYTGPFKETATVIGYGDPIDNAVDFVGTREMTGIRQITSIVNGNFRARGDLDTLLRPGNDITVDGLTVTVAFMNIFVTSEGQQYMDVGTR